MSKEKQIEEISEILTKDCGHCDNCKWLGHSNEKVDCLDFYYAEALYNAGYRKQSEGEWVPCDVLPADEDGEWTSYACSMCKHTTDSYYRDVHDLSRYCPNCGARMKGV